MNLIAKVPPSFTWPDAWEPVGGESAQLEEELRSELPAGHVLESRHCVALARGRRSDDVIFATDDPLRPFAVVHLTWKSDTEFHLLCPRTEIFLDLNEALSSEPL